jgi:hypothetical protein
MRLYFLLGLCSLYINVKAQNADKPFIKLVEPVKENNAVKASRNFLIGTVHLP